jgi:hypothetical protein
MDVTSCHTSTLTPTCLCLGVQPNVSHHKPAHSFCLEMETGQSLWKTDGGSLLS